MRSFQAVNGLYAEGVQFNLTLTKMIGLHDNMVFGAAGAGDRAYIAASAGFASSV